MTGESDELIEDIMDEDGGATAPSEGLGEAGVLDATTLPTIIPGGPSNHDSGEGELELTEESKAEWTKLKKISPKQEVLCHMAASGFSNQKICEELGYSDSRCSILLSDPLIKDRVRTIRESFWNDDVKKRFQRGAGRAMTVIEGAIDGTDRAMKSKERLDAAKWLLEKTTGKAPAELQVTGNILINIMNQLDALKDVTPTQITLQQVPPGTQSPSPVTQAPAEPADPIDSWISENMK